VLKLQQKAACLGSCEWRWFTSVSRQRSSHCSGANRALHNCICAAGENEAPGYYAQLENASLSLELPALGKLWRAVISDFSMPENTKVQTGIAGLDPIFLGGIRRGNLILVAGAPGSGKSQFGLEFVYRGITVFDEPGIIVVFESDPNVLHMDARAFGWDLQALEQEGRLKIIMTSPRVLDQKLRAPDSVLLKTAAEMGAKRFFIDSIALLRPVGTANGRETLGNGVGSYREVLQQLLEGLRREKLTAVLAHESGTHSESAVTLEIAEMLADTVIRLERGGTRN
jgi:circadian clock protein KaiC